MPKRPFLSFYHARAQPQPARMEIIFSPNITPTQRAHLLALAEGFNPFPSLNAIGFFMTPTRARKFQALFDAGFRANSTSCAYAYSRGDSNQRLTISEALFIAKSELDIPCTQPPQKSSTVPPLTSECISSASSLATSNANTSMSSAA